MGIRLVVRVSQRTGPHTVNVEAYEQADHTS